MYNLKYSNKEGKLQELHELEDVCNKQIGIIDKKILAAENLIKQLKLKNKKLAKSVSNNMKLRNKIITEIIIKK